ncbi:MAG TPA: BPSS1780 family membrane protein [Burkholderiaceae bacterium]|nr:BPSS1780 family membrane protein [Burkholderiaceae bacterium]
MQIRSLPASTGAAWLRDGWRLLKRQPLGLSAMVVMYTFVLLVPATIPFPYVGIALLGILSPFATVGLMAAFREVAAARVPSPGVFARAVQDATVRRALFKLGLIHGGLMILVNALAQLIIGPQPVSTDQEPLTLESLHLADFVVFALFYTPVMTVMWFAPLLAGWHGLDVGKAMFGSAVACWRNKGALLVYGFLMTCILVGVTLVTMAVLGAFMSAQTLALLAAPIGLALTTYVQASFYPMYRSIFAEEPAAA